MTQQVSSLQPEQKYTYVEYRVRTALKVALFAMLGVTIGMIFFFVLNVLQRPSIPKVYHLYSQFVGWGGNLDPFSLGDVGHEIVQHVQRLFSAVDDVIKSVSSGSDATGNVAGIARFCTVVVVGITIPFSYRRMMKRPHWLNDQPVQRDKYIQMSFPARLIACTLYTVASIFGAYVIVSIMWVGLSLVFKNMSLNVVQATIVIVLFTGIVTFVVAYGALAVTTSDILLLALATYGIGFLVSFALTVPTCRPPLVTCSVPDLQWWEVAVSNAGRANPSALLFTGTLFSGSLALIVAWFDVDSTIKEMIPDGTVRLLRIRVIRALFAAFILGLLCVGFIRVDQSVPAQFPTNQYFHIIGAVSAIAVINVFALLLILKQEFHRWYTYFSIGLIVVTIVMGALLLLKIVTLTVVELTILLMIGLWLYVTIVNIAAYARRKQATENWEESLSNVEGSPS